MLSRTFSAKARERVVSTISRHSQLTRLDSFTLAFALCARCWVQRTTTVGSKWTPLVNYDTPTSVLGTPNAFASARATIVEKIPWSDESDTKPFAAFAAEDATAIDSGEDDDDDNSDGGDGGDGDEGAAESDDQAEGDVDAEDGDDAPETVEATVTLGNFQPVPPVDLGTIEQEGTLRVRTSPLTSSPRHDHRVAICRRTCALHVFIQRLPVQPTLSLRLEQHLCMQGGREA